MLPKNWQYLYNTQRWKRLRQAHLSKSPYCECPHHKGQYIKAQVVDHIQPHQGDKRLFFNRKNLQSMTKECHDRFKQSQEKGGAGFLKGCDENGWPLSQEHEWYQSPQT